MQKHLHSFIQSPNLENLKSTAISMQKDLRRGDLGAVIDELKF